MPTKNLVTDFGGVGDGQRATLAATITSGTGALSVGAGTGSFVSGDIGKAIAIWYDHGAGPTHDYYLGTISARSSADAITVTPNITFAIPTVSVDILWGTDNTNAFTGVSGSWRAYAQTQTNPADIPILQIPDGNYAFRSLAAAGAAMHCGVFNSAKVSGLSGVAANCKLMQLNSGEMRFGTDIAIAQLGLYNGGNSVRLQTASAGAGTVTLTNPSGLDKNSVTYESRVVVGRVVLLAAYDMQGINNSDQGYPPNSFFFEWNVISGYSAGVVTLQNPLTQAYKSTYPQWGPDDTSFAAGHSQGADQGGPFTMWVAPDGYNNTVTLENMTIDSPHNQCSLHMRNWIANNIVINGPGLYPTQNDVVVINNSTYPQVLEIDKMVNQVTWNNSSLNILQQQSASPNKMIINGGSITQLETAKYTEANNVAFNTSGKVIFGVSSYGRTNQVVMNGCTGITLFQRGGVATDDLGGSSGAGSKQNASDFYTFVGGVIKFLKTQNDSAGGQGQSNLTRWAAPGTWVTFDDKYIDQVTDVYEDGTYCYIQFKNTTNWPFTPVLRLKDHPCPDFTMIGCAGTAPELEDWNQAKVRIPLYSYSKRAYTADGTGTTVKASPSVIGKLLTAKLNVTTPGSVTYHESQFDNWSVYKTDYTTYTFGPTIACVNGGLRTINGGSTASGAQGSDSIPDLTATGQIWFGGTSFSGPVFSANGSNAIITVEINTDQGIPPAIIPMMPLFGRLRLHA